jgi:hypothetical protein
VSFHKKGYTYIKEKGYIRPFTHTMKKPLMTIGIQEISEDQYNHFYNRIKEIRDNGRNKT